MGAINLPKLSGTESLIMDLLRAQEMYGLQLVNESKGRLKRGSVYVTLGRMEEKGYLESWAEEKAEHSGLPRRLYRATGLGARVHDAWSLMAASLASVRHHA
jgi:DNA-binding PadR family transcriptional regulator